MTMFVVRDSEEEPHAVCHVPLPVKKQKRERGGTMREKQVIMIGIIALVSLSTLYCFRPVKQKKVLVWDLPNRSLEARFDSLLL